jgi:hypothetical protein
MMTIVLLLLYLEFYFIRTTTNTTTTVSNAAVLPGFEADDVVSTHNYKAEDNALCLASYPCTARLLCSY